MAAGSQSPQSRAFPARLLLFFSRKSAWRATRPPQPKRHSLAAAGTRPKKDGSSRAGRRLPAEPRAGARWPRTALPAAAEGAAARPPRTNGAETADVPDIKFIDLSSFGRRKQTRTRDREGVFQ